MIAGWALLARLSIERVVADAFHRLRPMVRDHQTLAELPVADGDVVRVEHVGGAEQERQLLEIYTERFGPDERGVLPSGPLHPERIRRYCRLYQPLCFVLRRADRVVGYAVYRRTWTFTLDRGFVRRMWLQSIAIAESVERRGIGTALLTSTLPLVRRGRRDELLLFVEEDNPALRLYRRLGFAEVCRIKKRAERSSVLMRLTPDALPSK